MQVREFGLHSDEVFTSPLPGNTRRRRQIYVMQGRPGEALPEIELVRSEAAREFLYAITYATLGQEKQSDAALSELIAKHCADAAYQIAQVYTFRNHPDEAFEWPDRAYAQRDSGLIYAKAETL